MLLSNKYWKLHTTIELNIYKVYTIFFKKELLKLFRTTIEPHFLSYFKKGHIIKFCLNIKNSLKF
jgi:hypothetical protein